MTGPQAEAWYHTFVSCVYFLPILGAFLGDAILGKYRTILILSIVYCFGHLALAINHTRAGLVVGLFLIALGAGGIKPCVSANVGDQFGVSNQHLLARVFSWFYFSINLGSAFSTLLIPWLLDPFQASPAQAANWPAWLVRLLDWKPLEAGTFRRNRVDEGKAIEVTCGQVEEAALPRTFVQYEENPKEYKLSAINAVLTLAGDLGVAVRSTSAERTGLHVSLLAGLLSQIGMKLQGSEPLQPAASAPKGRRPRAEYLGARSARFAIFPGSSLARKPPDWIVAAELVETSRLWARTVARIEPEWVEPLARHLIRHSYSEPHWEKKRGGAVALEKVTLYGVPLVVDRKVPFGRIDPAAARELFIRHALVEGDWQTSHRFFAENRRLLAEAEEVEHRARRRGLVASEDELFAFYDARIPADVVSAQHFDTWWKQARRADPGLLTFKASDLLNDDATGVSADAYPDVWTSESAGVPPAPLSYAFEPGSESDGVTADIPLSRLNQVNPAEFSWQVPGLRTELVTEMIRSLPKALRRDLVPAPDVAREVVARLGEPSGDLRDAVGRELRALRGVSVPRDAWDLSKLPRHLRITVRVTDGDGSGRVLAEGKDVAELQRELRPRLRATLTRSWSPE
jgi:HrpA-like RNA helicase